MRRNRPQKRIPNYTPYVSVPSHTRKNNVNASSSFWVSRLTTVSGMSEMNGPGVAFECTEQNGLHIWEDNVIVEIVDPVTLQPVPEGEVGEVVTTINREAMPLLRYRTATLLASYRAIAPCGRTHKRLARFKGRSDDMIILKGVNLFPIQIERY